MTKERCFSTAYLHKRLDYNPLTGIFLWNYKNNCLTKNLKIAGHKDEDGYILIRMNGIILYGHRLAWKMTYAEDAPELLDHIDRNPSNNRVLNIREGNHTTNSQNRVEPKNNSSGTKGVSFDKRDGKWRAYISLGKKQTSLGYFSTKEGAVIVRQKAEKEMFGEFSPLT
jgi:hypothetical protein